MMGDCDDTVDGAEKHFTNLTEVADCYVNDIIGYINHVEYTENMPDPNKVILWLWDGGCDNDDVNNNETKIVITAVKKTPIIYIVAKLIVLVVIINLQEEKEVIMVEDIFQATEKIIMIFIITEIESIHNLCLNCSTKYKII